MKRQKYLYNKYYFDEINTNEKAYWLGFITADGYLMNNRNKDNKSEATGLRIRLAERDYSHLVKLNESLNYNKPLKIVKNYGIYENQQNLIEFSIYSSRILKSLMKYGLTSGCKSCHEILPNFNNIELTKNFILGLFDGDGSISYYQYKGNEKFMIEWQIVSSYSMCNSIKEFLTENIENISFQKISVNNKRNNELFRIRTGSYNTIDKLYEFFYKNNSNKIYLSRKFEIMKSIYERKFI